MAHYALLNSQNIVTSVFVGRDEDDGDGNWETVYSTLYGKTCKRTSYNTIAGVHINGGTPFRKNYAGVGYKYDTTRDAFIPPQPFNSWILNDSTCSWEAPLAYPDDGNDYDWDEDNNQWVQITLPLNT